MRITGITEINENESIYLMNNGEQYKVIQTDDTPPLCQWSKNLESLDESDSQAMLEILKNVEINVDGSKATACYEGCCEIVTGVSQLHPNNYVQPHFEL